MHQNIWTQLRDCTHFAVDGKPFAFVGANVEVMQGERNRARSEETLEAARADGLPPVGEPVPVNGTMIVVAVDDTVGIESCGE